MNKDDKPDSPRQFTRREVLTSVSKYSAAATGAAVVVLSADEALAQATSSNAWNCRDYYPAWLCWLFGYRSSSSSTQNFGGWNAYPADEPPADYGDPMR